MEGWVKEKSELQRVLLIVKGDFQKVEKIDFNEGRMWQRTTWMFDGKPIISEFFFIFKKESLERG